MQRFQKITNLLREEKCDAFLIVNSEYSGQPGTRYLSGFSGSTSFLIVTKHGKFLITDRRYYSQAQEETKHLTLIRAGTISFGDHFKKICKKNNVSRVVFDGARTPYSIIEKLKEKTPGIEFIDISGFLQEVRIVKNQNEIALLQKAADIAGGAFTKLLPCIKVGVTEKWLAAKLGLFMKEAGADKIAFETIVASGKNGAMPHAQPTSKKIQSGELITFDFGAYYKGYASDITRTVAVGEISARLKEIYSIVKKAQELGCRKARAGITGAQLDEICRNYITKKGYGKYFLHATGHGLGMEVHEMPFVSPNYTKKLPANSVITCEPGIYIEGFGGVRIEDGLVLKRGGNLNLNNNLSKDLITI